MPDPVKVAQGRLAYSHRRDVDPSHREDARRALTEAKLARSIREAVDTEPVLTSEQLDRLAALLRPAMRRAGA